LTHPNIVAVFDSGRDGPHHYIACAFVAGQPLEGRLEKGGALPQREAVEVARKLAEALAYAHKQGVIHRDVKPANVMLREDGEPLLMDFGLAARADEAKLTVEGQVMGTPAYCAPEQWRGEATAASDQYSVGCLLFELLTGQKPYAGRDIGHYLALHIQAPIPAVPGASGDLEAIVQKCLEKEPERRYKDCQELADDLGRWLRGEPTRARPVGPLGRLWRWAKREPVTASLVGAVAMLLVAGSLLAWGMAAWALGEKGRADGEAELKKEEALAARKAEKAAQANEALAIKRKEAADFEAFRAEDARHAIQMDLALRAWQDNDVARAESILAEVLPRFQQTWETQHLHGLCRRKAFPFLGHTSVVTSVCFSPDGKRILSGSDDNTLKVWDAQTGQEKLTLKGHTREVSSVCFSPDGKRILSGSYDKTLKVWDAQTGQEKLSLKGHAESVTSVCFSPDGKRILSGSRYSTLKVWDAQSGQEKLSLKGHAGEVTSVCFSPDGKRILSAS
jgi:putative hemolysin